MVKRITGNCLVYTGSITSCMYLHKYNQLNPFATGLPEHDSPLCFVDGMSVEVEINMGSDQTSLVA